MFNFEKKSVLKEKLSKYIVEYPEDAPEFLEAITEALKNYKQKVKQERNNQLSNALLEISSFIIDSKTLKKLDNTTQICFLVNTIFLMFPKAKITGHAKSEIDLFNYFCNLVKETRIFERDLFWLENRIDGKYLIEWLKLLIKENNLE